MLHFFDTPTFQVDLGVPVAHHQAAVAKVDGNNYSLICGSRSGRIVVHSPHDLKNEQLNEDGTDKKSTNEDNTQKLVSTAAIDSERHVIRNLNMNRDICCLKSVSNFRSDNKDVILAASRTNLLAYDMYNNVDIFSKDIPDGIFCMTIGNLKGTPCVIIGGNCCIQAFDPLGAEILWTVTGGVVTALCWCPSNDEDDNNTDDDLLLVGSDDCVIRSFKNEDIISEYVESGKITDIVCSSSTSCWFVYALNNGTVGAYDKTGNRLWQSRSKIDVSSLALFDVDRDGVPEVIIGHVNGSILVKSLDAGNLICKLIKNGCTISSLLVCDYRIPGQNELVVVCADGSVTGYANMLTRNTSLTTSTTAASQATSSSQPGSELLDKLMHEKSILLQEARSNAVQSSTTSRSNFLTKALLSATAHVTVYPCSDQDDQSIHIRVRLASSVQLTAPPPVRLPTSLSIGKSKKADLNSSQDDESFKEDSFDDSCLNISTIIASDGNTAVISDQSFIIYTSSSAKSARSTSNVADNLPSNEAILRYNPRRNLPVILNLNIMATCRGLGLTLPPFVTESSSSYHIHSIKTTVQICRYINLYRLTDPSRLMPGSRFKCSFSLPTSISISQVCTWINENFFIGQGLTLSVKQGHLRVNFIKISNNKLNNNPINMFIDAQVSQSKDNTGVMIMMTSDELELLGDIIQCLCKELGVDCLYSSAELPNIEPEVESIVERVKELNEARVHQQATSAETSMGIKGLVVAAEDCRIRRNMADLRKTYTSLQTLNSSLIMDHKLRTDGHLELVEKLKRLNAIIQVTSSLRFGSAKTEMVTACRGALRSMNVSLLLQLLRDGTLHK